MVNRSQVFAKPEVTKAIATIRDAPATMAPMTIDRPTPPTPRTATLAPSGTAAVLSTAPTPVDTQQPMRAATSAGTLDGSATAADAGTTVRSAIVPIAR